MEEFYKFLVDNGVLFQFLERLHDSGYFSLQKFCDDVECYEWVYSVIWSNSQEGWEYWEAVNRKWLRTFIVDIETNEK